MLNGTSQHLHTELKQQDHECSEQEVPAFTAFGTKTRQAFTSNLIIYNLLRSRQDANTLIFFQFIYCPATLLKIAT